MSDAAQISGTQPQAETDDAFLGGALNILQPKTGYRAGLDGILLAASVAADEGGQVLDVGAGVGVVGLAVARRLPDVRVTMIERDAGLAGLARRNIERNDLSERVRVIEADVARPLRDIVALGAAAETFDHVLANPPFHIEGRGTAASDPVKAGANAMPDGDLDRWVRFMAAMARAGGTATIIHRADALQCHPWRARRPFRRRGGAADPSARRRTRVPGAGTGHQGQPGSVGAAAGAGAAQCGSQLPARCRSDLRHGAALALRKAPARS